MFSLKFSSEENIVTLGLPKKTCTHSAVNSETSSRARSTSRLTTNVTNANLDIGAEFSQIAPFDSFLSQSIKSFFQSQLLKTEKSFVASPTWSSHDGSILSQPSDAHAPTLPSRHINPPRNTPAKQLRSPNFYPNKVKEIRVSKDDVSSPTKNTKEISPEEMRFLALLASNGGVCSRLDAARALGLKSLVDANVLLRKLCANGHLHAKFCNVPGVPIIYLSRASKQVPINQDWHGARDFQTLLFRSFFFSISLERRSFQEPNKLLFVTLPFEKLRISAKRLAKVIAKHPNQTIEVWTASQEHIDRLKRRMPPKILRSISKFQVKSFPLSDAYIAALRERNEPTFEAALELESIRVQKQKDKFQNDKDRLPFPRRLGPAIWLREVLHCN